MFDTKTKYICDKCFNDQPVNIKVENVTLDNGQVMIVSLFDTIYKVEMAPYILEINQIYKYFKLKFIGYEILIFDNVSLTFLNLELLSFLNECFDKKLIILCGILRK